MSKLSTATWVVHSLGLAASFGGTLFGKFALNPSVKMLNSKLDRGKVLSSAWNRYNLLNPTSLGMAAATWFVSRADISGRASNEEARSLVLAKDVLFGVAIPTGLASVIGQLILSRQAPEGATPSETGNIPAPETPDGSARLVRMNSVLGNVSIALFARIIAVTTMLSMKSGESVPWSIVSRVLP
jgi:hypothetical protein